LYDNSKMLTSEEEEEEEKDCNLRKRKFPTSQVEHDYNKEDQFKIPNHKGDFSRGEKVTVKDLYQIPTRKVPASLFKVCRYIIEENVEVSALNTVYMGNCVPNDRCLRKKLSKDFKAKFGKYTKYEDDLILNRFNHLLREEVIEDGREFLKMMMKTCCGKDQTNLKSHGRTLGARNILGLYIGQDIPNKLAFTNYNRLLKLVLNTSLLTKYVPVKKNKKRVSSRWTSKENKKLIKYVVQSQSQVRNIEDIPQQEVDWDGMTKSNYFGQRTGTQLREHWQRSIMPAILDDLELRNVLLYRKKLFKKIKKQEVKSSLEIDWEELEKSFWPRTRSMMQCDYWNLIKNLKIGSFTERVKEALRKVRRELKWPDEKLESVYRARRKRNIKESLREYFYFRISKQKK